MSTRACIATGTKEKWNGVYTHFDGYPTHHGPIVWKAIKDGIFNAMIDNHPGGWSSVGKECYCHSEYFTERDGSIATDSPYYSPDAPDGRMSERSADPLFIEWVYILDTESNVLHILSGNSAADILSKTTFDRIERRCAKKHAGEQYWMERVEYGNLYLTVHCTKSIYFFRNAASIPLDGDEPDWSEIEREDGEK
jgi:hypothetical protein